MTTVRSQAEPAEAEEDPDFHGAVFTDVPDDLDYVWPVTTGERPLS